MQARKIAILTFVLALGSFAAQAQTPVLGSIESPYSSLQTSVRVAGHTWGPGAVAYGPVGTPLVLSGANLGSTGTITFIPYKNGVVDTGASTVTAVPTMWTSSMIFVPVPTGALTGVVQVKVEGNTSTLPFIVTAGTYSGLCPAGPTITQLQIDTSSLHDGAVNQSYNVTLSAEGGTQAYTWSLVSGTLPAGLSLNTSTGVISGTPTASASSVSLTFEVTDSSSPHRSNQAVLDLTIEPQSLTPGLVYSFCVPDVTNANSNSACTQSTSAFDGDGNIHTYIDTVMGTWNFNYDALNRLQSASDIAGGTGSQDYTGQNFCFAYDSYGNRTADSMQTAACPAPSQESSQTATQSYDTSNQLSSGLYQYDASGDVIGDSTTGNSYTYDADGRICAVKSEPDLGTYTMTGYMYDAQGTRVAKGTITSMSCDPSTNGFQVTESYVLGAGGEELSMLDGQGNWQRTNVYASGKLVGTYDLVNNPNFNPSLPPSSTNLAQITWLHFQIEDPLGTRRMQISGGKIVVNGTTFADVGQPETNIQSLPYGDGLFSYPDQYAPFSADDATPLHFTGKERDAESGNDYFEARYYSSAIGRFLSPDWSAKEEPIPYAKLDNPQSLNLYSYVRNNPLAGVDSDGHDGPDCGCQQMTDAQVFHALNQASIVLADTFVIGVKDALSVATTGHMLNADQVSQEESAEDAHAPAPVSAPVLPPPTFVVTPAGTAVATDPNRVAASLKGATGVTSTPTTQSGEQGTLHTGVQTANGPVDVRTMSGSKTNAPRTVISHPGTNNMKTPDGKPTNIPRDSHIPADSKISQKP